MILTGIVLAGGLSTRMGRDKASLPWGDSDLLHTVLWRLAPVCRQLIVVSNTPRTIDIPNITVVADTFQRCGPLAGIHAGLMAASEGFCFVTACDMPYINTEAVAYIGEAAQGYDVAVPFTGGHYHPLHAVYHRRCLDNIERMLSEGNYRIADLYQQVKLRRISAEELAQFDIGLKTLSNFNTPEDLGVESIFLPE